MVNTVCTLYEITEGDNTIDEGLLPLIKTIFNTFVYDFMNQKSAPC